MIFFDDIRLSCIGRVIAEGTCKVIRGIILYCITVVARAGKCRFRYEGEKKIKRYGTRARRSQEGKELK